MTAMEAARKASVALEQIAAQDESPAQQVALKIGQAWGHVEDALELLRQVNATPEETTGETEGETEIFEEALRQIARTCVEIADACGFNLAVPYDMAQVKQVR